VDASGPGRPAGGLWIALGVTALVRGLTLWLGLGPFWDHPFVGHVTKDVYTWVNFFIDCQRGGIPYVDFSKEYPVGAGFLYWAMSAIVTPGDGKQLMLVHALVMTAADLLNTVLFFRLAREAAPPRALGLTLLFSLNLTAVLLSPVRFESWVVTIVLLGYSAYRAGNMRAASFWWSLGCSLKWFPAFFAAVQEYRGVVVARRQWQWAASLGVFVAVTVALNAPFIVFSLHARGDIRNWLYPYLFHAHRPLYWDTLLGVGELWLGALPVERYASLWTVALMGLAILVRPRLSFLYKGVLVCLAAIVFNRVYSTQFHLWFYPFLLLAAAREETAVFRRILVLFAALDALNVLVYPVSFTYAYREMTGFWPLAARQNGGPGTVVFSAAIVVRTFVVIALGALILRRPDDPDEPHAAPRQA
jgi:hypothetical protein